MANLVDRKIDPRKYGELYFIMWDQRNVLEIDEEYAYDLYKTRWKYVEEDKMDMNEKEFLIHLINTYGNGVFNA